MKSKLEKRINIGKDLLVILYNIESESKIESEIINFNSDYKIWDDHNIELLSFSFENQSISKAYKNVIAYFGLQNKLIHPSSKRAIYNRLVHYLPLKVVELESILNRIEFLELRNNVKNIVAGEMKKIFISHSSKDEKIVEKIIDLLEVIGVDSSIIFCTSFEGYNPKPGENFLDRIKAELDDDVLVLFVLSDNFYQSPMCLCEMGATWVKTSEHIPILIPPFTYDNIKGALPNIQGLIITEKLKLNSLKREVERIFKLKPISTNIWERKRDKILSEISVYTN